VSLGLVYVQDLVIVEDNRTSIQKC